MNDKELKKIELNNKEIKSIFFKSSVNKEPNWNEWKDCIDIEKYSKEFQEDNFFIEGYASSFQLEHEVNGKADRIIKGAFNEIVKNINNKELQLKLLYQHKKDETPLGYILAVKEDNEGLKYIALCNKSGRGLEIYSTIQQQMKLSDIERKDINLLSTSFEFAIEDGFETKENNITVRNITKISEVGEFSIVTYPRNTKAVITGIKSDKEEEEENFSKTNRVRKFMMQKLDCSSNIANDIISLLKGNNFQKELIDIKNTIDLNNKSIAEVKKDIYLHKLNLNKTLNSAVDEEKEIKYIEDFFKS